MRTRACVSATLGRRLKHIFSCSRSKNSRPLRSARRLKCRDNALAETPKSFWAKGSATASQLLQFLLEHWVCDMIDHCGTFEMKQGAS